MYRTVYLNVRFKSVVVVMSMYHISFDVLVWALLDAVVNKLFDINLKMLRYNLKFSQILKCVESGKNNKSRMRFGFCIFCTKIYLYWHIVFTDMLYLLEYRQDESKHTSWILAHNGGDNYSYNIKILNELLTFY